MKKIGILERVLIGFGLGIIAGAILGPEAAALRFFGTIFIRLLSMLVVPLVVSTLAVGVAGISGVKLGRVFGKTLFFYYVTCIFALIIGLTLANATGVGRGMELGQLRDVAQVTAPPFSEVLTNIVPTNIVDAMAKTTMLQIIFFTLMFGVAMGLAGRTAEPVRAVLGGVADIMYRVVGMVMWYAPIGVFALIAWTVGNHGLAVLRPFALLIAIVYIGCIVHVFVVHALFVAYFCRVNPLKFLVRVKDAPIFAFTTASSSATLPVTLRVVKQVGVSDGIAGFVLPIGATVNMDGTALYQTVAAVFIANAFGIQLTIGQQLTIAVTAVLASIGAAGVPGAGLIMLMTVLTSVGLPLEGIALIAGVDRILDMARTAVNVVDDITAAAMVATTEGERLSPDLYRSSGPGVAA